MPKCTDDNIIGAFTADAEFSGKQIDPSFYEGMSLKQKIGYSGSSGKMHRSGVKENPSEAIKKEIEAFKDAGLKQAVLGGHMRDPVTLFGKERIEPILKITKEWKNEVLQGGLTKVEGRKLWNEKVVPVVSKSKKEHFESDAEGYYKHMAGKYYKDLKDGKEVFGGGSNVIEKTAKNAAGYFTNLAPHIAIYDVFELMTKGITQYGGLNFTKGMANLLLKSKGVGAFGELAQNKALYFGSPFKEEGAKTGLQKAGWLLENLNPQKYSNNLLVNGAAEIGRAAKVDPAEAVRKIGFIKEIGNTPAYMRDGGASITWARYSTEAAKFYLDIHADLGRALNKKDPKAFTAALGQVITYHGLLTGLAGGGASLPANTGKLLSALVGADSEDELFSSVNELPFTNILGKATGLDTKKGLQVGAPAFGLAFSAGNSLVKGGNISKSLVALREDEPLQATGLMLDALHSGLALKYNNPFFTKTMKNSFILATDWLDGEEMEPEEKVKLFFK